MNVVTQKPSFGKKIQYGAEACDFHSEKTGALCRLARFAEMV